MFFHYKKAPAFIILLSCNLLVLITLSVNAEEIPYFKFRANMIDYHRGLFQLPIQFTYRPREDIANLYYQSGYFRVALLFTREDRDALLRYIDKYEEWNKKAIEKKMAFVKRIGLLNLKIYFKYADSWYEGNHTYTKADFYSFSTTRHLFILQFFKVTTFRNFNLRFRPDLLYFNYDDAQILKQAMNQNFIDKKVKENKDQQIPLDEIFK